MNRQPDYYIPSPSERGRLLAKALTMLAFAAIATGVFLGACAWAKSTARGLEVQPRTESEVKK